jgi:hypothetical protein
LLEKLSLKAVQTQGKGQLPEHFELDQRDVDNQTKVELFGIVDVISLYDELVRPRNAMQDYLGYWQQWRESRQSPSAGSKDCVLLVSMVG